MVSSFKLHNTNGALFCQPKVDTYGSFIMFILTDLKMPAATKLYLSYKNKRNSNSLGSRKADGVPKS